MSAYRRLILVAVAALAPAVLVAAPKPDVENGKTTFNNMCVSCHSVQTEGGATLGPNLLGVVGRKAASRPDFTGYSPALKASKITWNKKTLDKFLVNPNTMVPQTFMPMLIPDKKMRADVVAYLATLKAPK